MSREHFLSHSVLSQISTDSGNVSVSGLPWIDRGSQLQLPPQALASRVLCRTCNSALSQLDVAGAQFFAAINALVDPRDDTDYLCLVNGHDIERWLLKVMLGAIASRSLFLEGPVNPSTVEEWSDWVEMLAGIRSFSESSGLYLSGDVGSYIRTAPRTAGTTLLFRREPRSVGGLVISLAGLQFILLMGTATGSREGSAFEGSTYRPKHIAFESANYRRSVMFTWIGVSDGLGLEIHPECPDGS